MNKIILILAVCVLVSCEEAAVQAPVQSSFEGEFLKRKRGLKSLLSDRFTVLDTKNNTSQYYQLAFDVDSRQNYLLDGNSGDTLDSFVCLRNRSLWYLIRPNLDSAYTIQALEMRADTILGWNQSYEQMKAVDERVGRVEFSMDTLNSRHALIADKHAVRSLFGQILEQSEARYIIASQGDPERVRETDVPEQEMTADNQEIFVLYPNPASSFSRRTFRASSLALRF